MLLLLFAAFTITVNFGSCFDWDIDKLDVWYPDQITDEFTTKCFPELGCFYTGPPFFDPTYRPVSVPPKDNIQTKFYLFTRKNKDEYYDLKPTRESLKKSHFDGSKPLKIGVHGYEQNYTQFSVIKDELLKQDDYNVILVDHSHDNGPPYYQAVANARVTGANAAKLVHFLVAQTELKPDKVHAIGHSLGGQIVGYIGERVKNMARITGLDPAGPYFQYSPPEVRLDRSDAVFVDIIHTNAGQNAYEGEGVIGHQGHADFYPNGGNHMPACDHQHYLNITVISTTFGNQCSHIRSDDYFITSINSCKYTSYMCSSYVAFKFGLCDRKSTNRMGLFATKPKTPFKYYLDTDPDPPYCEVERRPWGSK